MQMHHFQIHLNLLKNIVRFITQIMQRATLILLYVLYLQNSHGLLDQGLLPLLCCIRLFFRCFLKLLYAEGVTGKMPQNAQCKDIPTIC